MSAGADRFFIDTNLLVYLFDSADPIKQRRAQDWIYTLWTHAAGQLSWQVLNEFYFNAVRKLRWPDAVIRDVVKGFAFWQPVPNSLPLMKRVWYWMDHAQVSYWDGLIVGAAELSGCRYLLSEDFQAGRQYGSITVVNPFETTPAELGLDAPVH